MHILSLYLYMKCININDFVLDILRKLKNENRKNRQVFNYL